MSSDLVTYTPPSTDELERTWQLASKLARTSFVPKDMRGSPEAVLACMLTGRELGIGQMQALRDIFIQNGRPAMMATLMAQLARRAGHKVRVLRQTDIECVVQIHRAGEQRPEEPVAWTLDDAKTAGLLSKDNWKHYPKAMLWNRAVSAAVRRDCSEVLGGLVYTPEELEDGDVATEAAWGEPVVDRQTGEVLEEVSPGPVQVSGAPAGPGAATNSAPTLPQIRQVRAVPDAKQLIKSSPPEFQALIPRAIADVHGNDPHWFWGNDSSVEHWRSVLEYAVELYDQRQHETAVAGQAPPPAADQTSPSAETTKGKGGQAEGDDPVGGDEVDGD